MRAHKTFEPGRQIGVSQQLFGSEWTGICAGCSHARRAPDARFPISFFLSGATSTYFGTSVGMKQATGQEAVRKRGGIAGKMHIKHACFFCLRPRPRDFVLLYCFVSAKAGPLLTSAYSRCILLLCPLLFMIVQNNLETRHRYPQQKRSLTISYTLVCQLHACIAHEINTPTATARCSPTSATFVAFEIRHKSKRFAPPHPGRRGCPRGGTCPVSSDGRRTPPWAS